jgi:hypothetical protein
MGGSPTAGATTTLLVGNLEFRGWLRQRRREVSSRDLEDGNSTSVSMLGVSADRGEPICETAPDDTVERQERPPVEPSRDPTRMIIGVDPHKNPHNRRVPYRPLRRTRRSATYTR